MIRACSTGAPYAAATPTSTPTPVPPRGAAASPAMISTPGNVSPKGATTPANPAIYDHGITQGASEALDAQTLWIFAAVRPLHQPQPGNAGGRCRRSLRPIAPPATGGPSGRRARSSTATTPPPSPRTGLPWTPASPGSRRRSTSHQYRRTSSSRSPATTVAIQISRGCGDVRCHQSAGDPRQRHRQHGVWGEWLQRAVVAQHQLSRAVPAPRPSPDPGGGLPAARLGAGCARGFHRRPRFRRS